MKCTCGAELPPVHDPTVRSVACLACGAETDLAATAGERTRLPDEGVATEQPPDQDPMIGKLLGHGRYRIESKIGQGGMGTVYLGIQTNLNRPVAVKVLAEDLSKDPHFQGRFQREAGLLASLDHPNIVSIHDLGEEDGRHYIVQAHVAGPGGTPLNLRELMAGKPLEQDIALGLIIQICSALQYAHGRGVVHRDIKPENILIDEEGNARIVDFGVARASLGEQTLTLPGTIMGSLRYMSPEQKVDSGKVDARSDLYSLGVVIYEMLTGTVPEGRFELPAQVRPNLDPRLDAIVDRALQAALERRYQSAAEVASDLSSITTAHLLREHQEQATPAAPKPPIHDTSSFVVTGIATRQAAARAQACGKACGISRRTGVREARTAAQACTGSTTPGAPVRTTTRSRTPAARTQAAQADHRGRRRRCAPGRRGRVHRPACGQVR